MRLTKIETIDKKVSYDISVKDTNCFFANDILVHNSNAGICYNAIDGIWAQSRENIITPQSDNAGFAFFVESNKEEFIKLMNLIIDKTYVDVVQNTISIYGEWCGGNIQKGVGISNLPKSFFIFGVKITPYTETEEERKEKPAYWVEYNYLKSPENKIYNISDYKTYSVDIDFNIPQLSQNKIIDMTIEVENECPVAKAFGFEGIGEGIVFSYTDDRNQVYRFKSKGEKHVGKSKVKTLKSVDDDKLNKIIETVNKVTPQWRLEQMLEKQFNLINGGQIDVKHLGDYIKLVMNDILKEELDVLSEAGVEPKDIGKYVSEVSRKYFFTRQNEQVGLK